MHRPSSTALLALLGILISIATATAASSEALDEALGFLARDDGQSAARVLESALPGVSAEDRPRLLQELRRAYELAAKRAEADGQSHEAENYRDNLKILNRKASPVVAERTEPGPPNLSAPRLAESVKEPKGADPVADKLTAADVAFCAGEYREAGRLYGALSAERRLPETRRDHYAYCLRREIVGKINARPKTTAEWAKIRAELDQVRALSPKHWYDEYLRDLADEYSRGQGLARSSSASRHAASQVVLRGSSPEEPASVKKAPVARSDVKGQSGEVAHDPAPALAKVGQSASPIGPWQVRMTANFRILHNDPGLAERVAQVAEASREAQIKRWGNGGSMPPWSPKCDIFLYPTASVYSQMTGQPESSPGFSTYGTDGMRINARRINLHVDHPDLLRALLPHEVTHIVLADQFAAQPIPRWADEGMAVLSEPASEQRLRAGNLAEPLKTNRLFQVEKLMAMDYPDPKYWDLYYAQSVSLTRFLVEKGTPAQFVAFLKGAEQNGFEPELRRVYQIDGFADLQRRWLDHARTSTTTATASANDPTTGPTERR